MLNLHLLFISKLWHLKSFMMSSYNIYTTEVIQGKRVLRLVLGINYLEIQTVNLQ